MRELKQVRRGYVPEFIPRIYFLQLFYAKFCCDFKELFYVHSVCKLRLLCIGKLRLSYMNSKTKIIAESAENGKILNFHILNTITI